MFNINSSHRYEYQEDDQFEYSDFLVFNEDSNAKEEENKMTLNETFDISSNITTKEICTQNNTSIMYRKVKSLGENDDKKQTNNLINDKKNHKICFCSQCGRVIFDEYQNISLNQFIEYLNEKINGHKNKKVPKDALCVLYRQLQFFLNLENLKRNEKRDKNRIFLKMYDFASNVIFCLENMPHLFLEPVLIHLKSKINMKKVSQKK